MTRYWYLSSNYWFSQGRGCYQSPWSNKWDSFREEWADFASSICKKHSGIGIRAIRIFSIKQSCCCCNRGSSIFSTGLDICIYMHIAFLSILSYAHFPGAFSNMKFLGVHVIKSKETFFRSSSVINVMLQNDRGVRGPERKDNGNESWDRVDVADDF